MTYLFYLVCMYVCLSVSVFLMHGHRFERISTKFDTWHPYTLRMVMDGLTSAARARKLALREPSVLYTPLQIDGRNSELAGGRRNGPSTAGVRIERRRREE